MSENVLDNIDDLEALLADLADFDEPTSADELTSEELDALAELESSLQPVAVAEPEPEPVAEPVAVAEPEPVAVAEPEPVVEKEELDEVEAILAAAAVEPEQPKPVAQDTSAIFEPESNLNTFIDANKLKADLDFSITSISVAMTRQASLFAHYSTLASKAQFQADRASQQLELVEAQLDQKYRDSFAGSGTKVTENVIKSSIIKDERYQKAMLRKNESRAIADMVRSAADSFRHRKDMLIQVGADLRQEAQGSVRVKENQHSGIAAMERLRNAS